MLIYFLVTDRSRIARTGLVFEEPAIEAELSRDADSGRDDRSDAGRTRRVTRR